METALENMGRMFYAVLDKDDTIETPDLTKGDRCNVFLQLVEINQRINNRGSEHETNHRLDLWS